MDPAKVCYLLVLEGVMRVLCSRTFITPAEHPLGVMLFGLFCVAYFPLDSEMIRFRLVVENVMRVLGFHTYITPAKHPLGVMLFQHF